METLLGIKGYVNNIPPDVLSNEKIISHYQELWQVEQAFRICKTDLKTRPIFHYTQEAIKAHVLICFIALIMGKFLEMKTGQSLKRIRDSLLNVHEAKIIDQLTGKTICLRTNLNQFENTKLSEILKTH